MLGVGDVALALGVHRNSVKRIPGGELPFWRFGSRGDRRYRAADVEAYMRRRRGTSA